MVKISKTQAEQDKIKVLDALEQYSKEKSDKIAESCGFSRQKVSRIIKNLEKNKVIWGYPPVTDDGARNLKQFLLLVKRKPVPFDDDYKKELIFDKLDSYFPNVKVENISLTHGQYDGFVTFYAKDILCAKKLVGEIFTRIGKYFKEYELLETIFPIRKQGLKNPKMKELSKYL
jgi:DNA-binding Lrp family transcriptional regulator